MIDRCLSYLIRSCDRVREGLFGVRTRNAVSEGEGELEFASGVVRDDVGDAEGSGLEVTLRLYVMKWKDSRKSGGGTVTSTVEVGQEDGA